MSYDLFFLAPSGKSIAAAALREHFEKRPNFHLKEKQAWYENEDTGVYFSFDLEPSEPQENPEQVFPYLAHFELQYYRPHVFGLEAEPEVSAFIQAFDLGIHDPQICGTGNGSYSRDGFLNGWNKGNALAYEPLIPKRGRPFVRYSLPGEKINRYWRWNYARAEFQKSLGDSAFVPPIMFLIYKRRLASAVAWLDAWPIALPQVDIYMIVRDELFPKFADRYDIHYATSSEVERLVAQYPLQDGPVPFRLLRDVNMLDLYYWVRNLPGGGEKPEIVNTDQILDGEIINRIAAARRKFAWPRLPWRKDDPPKPSPGQRE